MSVLKLLFLFPLAFTSVLAQNSSSEFYELNIVHYNDFHAHFGEITTTGSPCDSEADGACMGGFARLYTAIMEAFEDEPDSILLNGGDTFQGTIWYNFLRWNVSQHFMNMLPHDAHVLGNHEFDHGVEGLVPYLERLNSPMLGANVNATFEPTMLGLYQNHVVIERHGRKIGIIGVLLQTFSAPIGNIIMEDEVEAINREAAILSEQDIDIIIVLSHCGYASDLSMAAQISSSVDIIVGAHSHTLLYTGDNPSGDNAGGEYPTVVNRNDGHRILVVQASCYTRYLGNIKLYIDEEGIIQYWEGQPVHLGNSIIKDPYIEELLEPWRAEVDAVGKEVLGTTKVTLNRSWCYTGECNLGTWACNGFLEDVMHRAEGTAWHDAHVCMINAGGLRVQIDPGGITEIFKILPGSRFGFGKTTGHTNLARQLEVTTEGLLMAMPFENYVQIYDLKGEYLQEALEFAVGTSQSGNSFYSGRMLQVGGMRLLINASQPVGSRVTTTIRCIDCDVPIYEPIDLEANYRVITQDYIGDGGGGYTMLSDNRENVEVLDVDYVVIQRYMRKQGTIIQDLDGRIEIVW